MNNAVGYEGADIREQPAGLASRLIKPNDQALIC